MITIRFTGSDWTRIRFGISPLWETVAAVRASAGAGFGSGSDPGDRILRRLGQLDLPLLRRVVDPHRAYLPDFLAPPPDSADVSFAQELGGVVATSPALVQRELRLAGILTTRREAATTVERLAGELQAAWEWAVVPEWPAIRGVLEQDIAWRAREVTRGGAEGMLAGLHPSLTSDGFSLTIRTDRSATRTSAGAGLSLIPSVFAWPRLYVVDAAPWRPTIAYPARGLASAATSLPGHPALAALTGDARSRVLLAIGAGATTESLAVELRLSAGAVSQHLNRLRHAGVVRSTRIGRQVEHQLTARGEAILASFLA